MPSLKPTAPVRLNFGFHGLVTAFAFLLLLRAILTVSSKVKRESILFPRGSKIAMKFIVGELFKKFWIFSFCHASADSYLDGPACAQRRDLSQEGRTVLGIDEN